MSTKVTRAALIAAARGYVRPGISNEAAYVLGFADLSGQPLNLDVPDDGAVVLRAKRLVEDGVGLGEALHTARDVERATWVTPEARR